MPWKKSKQMYLRWTFDGHEVLCLLTQHSFFCLTVKPPQRAKTFSTHFNLKLTMRYDFSTLTAALLVSVAVVLVLVPSSMGRNDEPRDNDLRRTFGVQKRASEGHGSRPASPEHPAPAWHEHPTWNHPDLFKPNARLWSSPSTSPERFRPGQTTKSPGNGKGKGKEAATPSTHHQEHKGPVTRLAALKQLDAAKKLEKPQETQTSRPRGRPKGSFKVKKQKLN